MDFMKDKKNKVLITIAESKTAIRMATGKR